MSVTIDNNVVSSPKLWTAEDNKAELFQVMACRRTGDKPLPEATSSQFSNAYMRHKRESNFNEILYVCP